MLKRLASLTALCILAPLCLPACGGSDAFVASGPAAPGAYKMDASGGQGGADGGSGGSGGSFSLLVNVPLQGVEILKTGVADASFTPSAPTVILGSNPLLIAADTTLAVLGAEPALGTPYFVANDTNIYISDGNAALGDETPVTGVRVAAGATLTLGLNVNAAADASINLSHTLDVQGTLTTESLGSNRGPLTVNALVLLSRGTIDLAGTVASPEGGSFDFVGDSLFNFGSLLTRGADGVGVAGGAGGAVSLSTSDSLETTGVIDARGGSSDVAAAGAGGSVSLLNLGSTYVSGALHAQGGDGSVGGPGASVLIQAAIGDIRQGATVNAFGGVGSAGPGAPAGSINLTAVAGGIRNSGHLRCYGGDSLAPASPAGPGGIIIITALASTLPAGPGGQTVWAWDAHVEFSGDLDVHGGNAVATGTAPSGPGGSITVNQSGPGLEGELTTCRFLGYDRIDLSGGEANFPGSGGTVSAIFLGPTYVGGGLAPGYGLKNEADVSTRGGSVAATATTLPAAGGPGGTLQFTSSISFSFPYNPLGEDTENSGAFDASGGTGFNGGGGSAGPITFTARGNLHNTGALTARGGADLAADGGTDGTGGPGGQVILECGLDLINSGALDTSGGDGEYVGGMASPLWIRGFTVANSGALSARGGNADAGLAGSTGGTANFIDLDTSAPGFGGTSNSGAVSVLGGTGTTPGMDSYFVQAGVCQFGNCP